MTLGADVIYWWSWHQTHTRPHTHTSDEKIYDSHGLYILQYCFDPLCFQLNSRSFKHSRQITRTAYSLPGTLIAYIIISTHQVSIISHPLTTALVTHFAPRLYALTLSDYCYAAATPFIDIISIDTAEIHLNCKKNPSKYTLHMIRHLVTLPSVIYKSTHCNKRLMRHRLATKLA